MKPWKMHQVPANIPSLREPISWSHSISRYHTWQVTVAKKRRCEHNISASALLCIWQLRTVVSMTRRMKIFPIYSCSMSQQQLQVHTASDFMDNYLIFLGRKYGNSHSTFLTNYPRCYRKDRRQLEALNLATYKSNRINTVDADLLMYFIISSLPWVVMSTRRLHYWQEMGRSKRPRYHGFSSA